MPVSLRPLARADLAAVELVELVRAAVPDNGSRLGLQRPGRCRIGLHLQQPLGNLRGLGCGHHRAEQAYGLTG